MSLSLGDGGMCHAQRRCFWPIDLKKKRIGAAARELSERDWRVTNRKWEADTLS